jgi:hypothetical protein
MTGSRSEPPTISIDIEHSQFTTTSHATPPTLNSSSVTLLPVLTKLALVLFAVATIADSQTVPRPEVPENIKPPEGEQLVLQVHAVGFQIYVCQQTDAKYAWALKAPDAELHDQQGSVVGRHYAGPAWKYKDGSEVTGKLVAKSDSPDADSIPWLLLTATAHSRDGILSRVDAIQRIHTKGGLPPKNDCDASKVNHEMKSAYTADYYFYAPAK